MIIVTSLSCNHANGDNQIKAIESWQPYGKCYSLNGKDEINQLRGNYEGITFIETNRTIEALVGKKLVNINAMIDFADSLNEDLLIINSDIILSKLPSFKNDGVTIFSRYDYIDDINDNKIFAAGFDAFFIPKQLLSIFPPSIYAMGCAWWDYTIPYRAQINNIPVYYFQGKHAFHKVHPTQYDYQQWLYIGEFFKCEFKIDKQLTIPQIAVRYLTSIKSKLIVMKTCDIFIKSYLKDFWLLHYALESIKRNVTGYNNLILLIPESEKDLFDTRNMPDRTLIHYIEDKQPGWLAQQWFKMSAYKYCYADYIMFSDSDCLFTYPINLQDFLTDDRPEILYTDWEKVGDAICWKKPTEQFMQEDVPYEFMRRNNCIYHRETLTAISNYAPDLEETILTSERFSEFNCLGAWAYKNEREKYTFINTDDWIYTEPKAQQCWSHISKDDGVSETHLREYIRTLETIMKSCGIEPPK